MKLDANQIATQMAQLVSKQIYDSVFEKIAKLDFTLHPGMQVDLSDTVVVRALFILQEDGTLTPEKED